MMPRALRLAAIALATSASAAAAQATFTPSYNAPYRSFEASEFGGTFSFPHGSRDFAVEGQFRFGFKKFDIGLRGGIIDRDQGTDIVLGVEVRGRVFDHTQGNFPLDGAVVVGVGTNEFDVWTIPSAGLSLGRRVDLDGFSFVLYGQPTLFVFSGNDNTDLKFGLGFGGDFKVGQALDLRVSAGVFDGPKGLAVSLVWIR
jgi:opacity protein-like surface antigen